VSTDQLDLVRFEGDEEDESAENVVAGGSAAVVAPSDWTASTIVDQIARKRIELSPGFQRRDAWQPTRKSRFIESLIVGIPVPQVLLAESQTHSSAYVVIDGKQRLLALQQFFDGGLVLQGLNIREDLNGETFDSLQEAERDRLENQTLRAVLLRNWSNVDFLYHVFIRLNSESLPLSPQELRGALFPGPFLDYADDLTTSSEAFHQMLRLSGPDFRMRDVELLVRFFAFDYLLEDYQGNLRELLDETCKRLNRQWLDRADEIRARGEACEGAIAAVLEVFGNAAFRRWDGERLVGPFNRAVFDCLVMYAKDPAIAGRMRDTPEQIVAAFKDLCGERRFTEAVSSTTKSVENTRYRLSAWARALGAAINVDIAPPVVGRG
jgi:Protein of unknown function DUF262